MSEGPVTPVVSPNAWRMARLSVLFVFDVARISRGDGDLLEPLILTAVLQANQAAIATDPELQVVYGDAEWSLPDEHRRPISVNAIAQSLDLPFETVRRKAKAMADRGLVVVTPQGLVAPQAAVVSEPYVAVLRARVDRLAQLCEELVAAGLQPPIPSLRSLLSGAPRAADRVLAGYMLRVCNDLIELAGGAMPGMVLLALAAANLRELQVARVDGWDVFSRLAQACSAAELSRELGMSDETVRRRLHQLVEDGFCARTGADWIAAAPARKQRLLGRIVEANAQNLRRLMAQLAELDSHARAAERREARGGA
jgi:DNA-binding Lrp family transcriptional regulator